MAAAIWQVASSQRDSAPIQEPQTRYSAARHPARCHGQSRSLQASLTSIARIGRQWNDSEGKGCLERLRPGCIPLPDVNRAVECTELCSCWRLRDRQVRSHVVPWPAFADDLLYPVIAMIERPRASQFQRCPGLVQSTSIRSAVVRSRVFRCS